MAELMSKAAYARHRGVGKSAVSNWVKRGQIVLVGTKVDVAASDAKLGMLVDPGRGRDATGGEPLIDRDAAGDQNTVKSSTVADSAQAQLAEERLGEIRERRIGQAMKNAQTAGELVDVAEYESRLATLVSGFCERMQSELRSKAEALALENDKRAIRALLDDTIHQVRSDFAARIELEVEAAEED